MISNDNLPLLTAIAEATQAQLNHSAGIAIRKTYPASLYEDMSDEEVEYEFYREACRDDGCQAYGFEEWKAWEVSNLQDSCAETSTKWPAQTYMDACDQQLSWRN